MRLFVAISMTSLLSFACAGTDTEPVAAGPIEEPLLRDYNADPGEETESAMDMDEPAGMGDAEGSDSHGDASAFESEPYQRASWRAGDSRDPVGPATDEPLEGFEDLEAESMAVAGDSPAARLTIKGKNKKGKRALKGCVVKVGGHEVGKAPLSKVEVPSGTQEVSVQCKGRTPYVKHIELAAADITKLTIGSKDLKKRKRRGRR